MKDVGEEEGGQEVASEEWRTDVVEEERRVRA